MPPQVHSFAIQPISRFDPSNTGVKAAIKRPHEIASFSFDENHSYKSDDSSLKYYYPPKLNESLSNGFETFRQLNDDGDDHLDALLRCLAENEAVNGLLEADVVTWRGMMTKILTTPYAQYDGFEMNATRFQGTIFIEESHDYKLESRKQQHSRPNRPGMPSQDLMAFWGYKFEAISLLPQPWDECSRDYIEDRPNHTVSNHEQYCSVAKTSIGGTTLVMGGEVDAVWDSKPARPSSASDEQVPINWVELKTSALPRSAGARANFERKLNKFWAQSFLLGVPKIVVGYRDEHGILLDLEEFETLKIPGLVRSKGQNSWESNICIGFLSAFLSFLKDTITEEGGVWKIIRTEKSQIIEIWRQEETGYGDILSQDFVAWREEVVKRSGKLQANGEVESRSMR